MASGIQAFRGVMTTDDDTHNRAQAQLQSVMGPITSAAILNGRLVTGVVLTGAGASVIVNHGLGRAPLGWVVVRRYSVAAEAAWVAPTLLNNWVNTAAPWEQVGYRLDSMGVCHLRGFPNAGTVSATVASGKIFTLPTGYRPSNNVVCAVDSNLAFGVCVVNSTGEVQAYQGNNANFSLGGISFQVSLPTTADVWDNNAATASQLTLLSRLAMTVDLWVF